MLNFAPNFVINNDDLILPHIPCNYVDPPNLNTIMGFNREKSHFSLVTLNIRSCRKNFNLLTSFINTYLLCFSVIVLVETWLMDEIDIGFGIPGYKQLNLYRNSHGGGIKVLFRDVFNANIVDELTFMNDICEVLSFYLCFNNLKFFISCTYRRPSFSISRFNDLFVKNVLGKLQIGDNALLTGDFNINLYNPLELLAIVGLINIMLSYNFLSIIDKATIYHPGNTITHFQYE